MLIPLFGSLLLGQQVFETLHNFSWRFKSLSSLTVLSLFIFLEGVSLQTGVEITLFWAWIFGFNMTVLVSSSYSCATSSSSSELEVEYSLSLSEWDLGTVGGKAIGKFDSLTREVLWGNRKNVGFKVREFDLWFCHYLLMISPELVI